MKKERPEITTRKFTEVIKKPELGFSYYTLGDLERAGWCYRAEKGPQDIPDVAHWQILYYDSVRTHSGYENDTGSDDWIWRIWIFEEEALWQQAVQFYYDDAADQSSPTNTQSYRGPMKLVFLDCSGKVTPHVSVALAFDRRG